MKVEGLFLEGMDERKRERNDKVVKRYTIHLRNTDGERITITTESRIIHDLCVGQDIDLEIKQSQSSLTAIPQENGKMD